MMLWMSVLGFLRLYDRAADKNWLVSQSVSYNLDQNALSTVADH